MKKYKVVFFIKTILDGQILLDNIEPENLQSAIEEALQIQILNKKRSDQPTFYVFLKSIPTSEE